MTTDLTRIGDARTTRGLGGAALPGTVGWYSDASGGFIPETPDSWNSQVAFLVFPRITSSPRIDRRAVVRFDVPTLYISALSVADQVRELQTVLSLNKSELAHILRVSRPTVYDWLDDGQPNADNVSRIEMLLRLLRESRVSPANPLFPRFVRSPLEPGGRPLLEALSQETIDEANLRSAIRKAKAVGDAIDSRREEREARLRAAGFEEPDAEQRQANLATNVALTEWPRE